METVKTIKDVSEIPQLLELDSGHDCETCVSDDTSAAHATIRDLCTWWLGDVQRARWKADTMIKGNRREDGSGNDVIFQVEPAGCAPVCVFLVITQHNISPDKKKNPKLHYQLQIPAKKELRSTMEANGIGDVRELEDNASRGVDGLRYPGKISVSLHKVIDLGRVHEVIGELVDGLVDLLAKMH